MGKLPHESRLADPGFTNDSDNLALALTGSSQCLTQQLDLGFAADEASESSRGGGVQSAPHRVSAGQLEDLDRLA